MDCEKPLQTLHPMSERSGNGARPPMFGAAQVAALKGSRKHAQGTVGTALVGFRS